MSTSNVKSSGTQTKLDHLTKELEATDTGISSVIRYVLIIFSALSHSSGFWCLLPVSQLTRDEL